VTLLVRPRLAAMIEPNGLRISDLDGRDGVLSKDSISVTPTGAGIRASEIVLVTVKSGATAEMAKLMPRMRRLDAQW